MRAQTDESTDRWGHRQMRAQTDASTDRWEHRQMRAQTDERTHTLTIPFHYTPETVTTNKSYIWRGHANKNKDQQNKYVQ